MKNTLLLALALATSGVAFAQTSVSHAANPIYRSTFDGYRGWQPQESLNWRGLNDEMKQLGGHAGHLRAGSGAASVAPAASSPAEPSPSASTTTPSPQRAMPQGHGGHVVQERR